MKNYKAIGYREVLEYLIEKRQSKLLDKIKDGGINNENFYKIYY